jgi:hypothetical protein
MKVQGCDGSTARVWVTVLMVLLAGGCKPSVPTDAVKDLTKPFSQKGVDGSGDEAERNRTLAELATAAARSNDLQTVGASLQNLRTSRTLTVDQRMAVQEAMANFQGSLAERADRGDAAAKAALDSLRAGRGPR